MDIGVAYINKITNLYGLDSKIKADMLEVVDKIAKAFDNWCWEDIEYAIDYYYTRKNDKNYPKVAQIQAILNTNTHDKRKNTAPDTRNDDGWYNLPSTRIKIITDAFLSVCKYAHKIGVVNIPYFSLKEGIPCGWDTYVKYSSADDKVGRIWHVRWDWDDAVEYGKQKYPDVFGKFKGISKLEEYTFAYKLGLIEIKKD